MRIELIIEAGVKRVLKLTPYVNNAELQREKCFVERCLH